MSRSQQLHRPGPPSGPPGDDTDCTVLHVDMDAFYASVELISRPELRGTPVIVGGGSRGVVLSATYEARRYGVHSAMPMTRARRLCPQATVVPPSHGLYSTISAGVMEIFRSVTPLVEPLSLDEAFLDVSGAVRRLGRPTVIAQLIRDRVADEQGITCSVGVATTKFVAKLGSTRAKPDGMIVVPSAGVVAFLHPLPVGALWGVGEKTEKELTRLGLRTVGDIANTPRSTLVRALGQATGSHLHALSWGRDERTVVPHEPDKSIGAEETFARDVDDPEVVLRELLRLSEKSAARLRSAGLAGRTVSLKVRFADFTTITRSRTLPEATDVAAALYGTARMLYEALGLDRARLRLVGIRVEQLVISETAPHQLLLGERNRGRREVEQAADRAALRFGNGAVRPATLVGGDGSRHPPEKPVADRPAGGPDGQREQRPDRSPERRTGPSGGRTAGSPGDRPTTGRNLPNG